MSAIAYRLIEAEMLLALLAGVYLLFELKKLRVTMVRWAGTERPWAWYWIFTGFVLMFAEIVSGVLTFAFPGRTAIVAAFCTLLLLKVVCYCVGFTLWNRDHRAGEQRIIARLRKASQQQPPIT